ncbi:hypothetical protein BP6252_02163 [Coleophoma cylindrospora]|uniref:Anaphase-promoting complex subunit 4 n=1 Tax=Coleophoma cylindrospora TaxID=1849047 RepID=A0A3D8SE29_9HELO|nr:hypothetical protein BP6252_02163 [Coleophoma cylindrospora]
MDEPIALEVLSEKTLHHAVNPRLVAYCPSMDLLALVSTDQQVLVFRLNGQRVFTVTQKARTLKVDQIRWKPNGQLLAISWSDGTVRLVSAESSKAVHQFSTSNDDSTGVTCMGWALNTTVRKPNSTLVRKGGSWEKLLGQESQLFGEKAPLDLPQDLTLIDIEVSLPKLSVLAAGGISEDIFSSRSSLDALFRPFDPRDKNAVDVMVVGTNSGRLHLSIYDSFVIGSFQSPVSGSMSTHLVLHEAHEQYSTHNLLLQDSSKDGDLYYVPMDLRFISASSEYLSLLASRSTALQNLLRYIHQVQSLMISEWKATQELPGKFLRNINETLAENETRDIVQSLYHSVATGHTFPIVKEWLVDELSERGHKRWDKAVVGGLEGLRRLVHENMLPALERCSVILSRLTGIAKFQGSNDTIGFSSQQIALIVDTVACLNLVASKILMRVVEELDLFASFSSWLRYEIDRLASDSAVQSDEAMEKESSIDHSKVLLYLQTVMTGSPLAMYLQESSEEQWNEFTGIGQGVPKFNLLDQEIQKHEARQSYLTSLPRLDLLCKNLSQQADTVFKQIADAEKRNVLFGSVVKLGGALPGSPMDMSVHELNNTSFFTYIAFVPESNKSQIHVVRIEVHLENGISTQRAIETSSWQLGEGLVVDMKIFDDSTLLVLWEFDGTTSLLNIPYASPNPPKGLPTVGSDALSLRSSTTPKVLEYPESTRLENDELMSSAQYTIPGDESFLPTKLEIRAQTGRYKPTPRLIVLGKGNVHYKVLGLPAASDDEDTSMGDQA